MQPKKLKVLIVLFCYGGNGGVATILPEIAIWLARVSQWLKDDERVESVAVKKAGDIPLSMERNRVVKDAQENGYDVVVMVDSDNVPDLYKGAVENFQPFLESSFDFLYERSLRSLPTVVCAPYCGPPLHPVKGGGENVYVFYATEDGALEDGYPNVRFEAYSREHASMMRGIQPIAAGPTGLIMYSIDAFDLMPVHGMTDEEILIQHMTGKLSTKRALELLHMQSWFFYEYTDHYQTKKASTEDVTNTREIQFAGIDKHGEPIVFCNWDSWAGHYKPKCVGAPAPLHIESVSELFKEAVERNLSNADMIVNVDFSSSQRSVG